MRLEDIKEDMFLYCKTADQHGVQQVRVLEKVNVEINPDQWEIGVRYTYRYQGTIYDSIQHPHGFSRTRNFRKPKCYECDVEIDEDKYEVEQCNKCGWLICPRDKACGCNR